MPTANAPTTASESHVYGPPVEVVVSVRVTALAFQEADGGYSVVVPELPNVVTEADSIEDVEAMVVEAAEGCMAVDHSRNRASAIRVATGRANNEASAS